jgi:hypothetical protein
VSVLALALALHRPRGIRDLLLAGGLRTGEQRAVVKDDSEWVCLQWRVGATTDPF